MKNNLPLAIRAQALAFLQVHGAEWAAGHTWAQIRAALCAQTDYSLTESNVRSLMKAAGLRSKNSAARARNREAGLTRCQPKAAVPKLDVLQAILDRLSDIDRSLLFITNKQQELFRRLFGDMDQAPKVEPEPIESISNHLTKARAEEILEFDIEEEYRMMAAEKAKCPPLTPKEDRLRQCALHVLSVARRKANQEFGEQHTQANLLKVLRSLLTADGTRTPRWSDVNFSHGLLTDAEGDPLEHAFMISGHPDGHKGLKDPKGIVRVLLYDGKPVYFGASHWHPDCDGPLEDESNVPLYEPEPGPGSQG